MGKQGGAILQPSLQYFDQRSTTLHLHHIRHMTEKIKTHEKFIHLFHDPSESILRLQGCQSLSRVPTTVW